MKKQSTLTSFFKVSGQPSTPNSAPSIRSRIQIDNDESQSPNPRHLKRINADLDDSPVRRSVKRKRVILSSDEEDDADDSAANFSLHTTPKQANKNGNNALKTPTTGARAPCSTPSTAFRTPGRTLSTAIAESFIDSFRLNRDSVGQSSINRPDAHQSVRKATIDLDKAEYVHETLAWLKPDKIKDAAGRLRSDPEYDCTTLYVPPDFLKEQTPGHRQWWTQKTTHFDTILFFKVGKFYEMYHMDAVIGVKCLSLAYMKGKFAHCGFPEAAYGKFADQLVARGYKVGRIEQTETPQQLEERNAQSRGAKDKVVKRELCRITTTATRTFGVLDCADNGIDGDSSPKYLLAVTERSELVSGKAVYGICLVDTSIGQFKIGQFVDDDYRSYLRTLIATYIPSQILLERGAVKPYTNNVFASMVNSVPTERLAPKKQFLSPDSAIVMLADDNYLGADYSVWPAVLKKMVDPHSSVCKPNGEFDVSWKALGAVLWYLKRCLIDVDMVTMKDFVEYSPSISREQKRSSSTLELWKNRTLVLDGVTLENLNIIPTGDAQSDSLSLYSILNKCHTHFGKRLLREWVCAPTCDPHQLLARQDTVAWLLSSKSAAFVQDASSLMRELGDLQKLMQKIHALGLKYRAEIHPDSRAVMFDSMRYNKRKVKDLSNALAGLGKCQRLFEIYADIESDGPPLFSELLGSKSEFCDISEHLNYFNNLFNRKVAEESGCIVPEPGQDADFDRSVLDVKNAERELERYREEQQKVLRCAITYWGTGRNRYQMEITDSKTLSSKYELKSRRKGFGRYQTPELVDLIDDLSRAEHVKEEQAAESTRKVFAAFDDRKHIWKSVVSRIAVVDVLFSLARYASTCGIEVCRPEFVFDFEKPFVSIVGGSHPCLAASLGNGKSAILASSSTFIANDTDLGGDSPLIMLLTGPNMGGKSTLMRQVAVLSIMAHLGSFVPARSMKLTPVDRIFTRIGASDRIMSGQSTFFVEMNETQIILRDATPHSLVLVDELGRGTSTYDGTAVATAVLHALAESVRCRTFFSTHYHTICKIAAGNLNIAQSHMACMVENENEEDPTEETVTFLYRLTTGICPKSYGFYAAKLAGISKKVVRNSYVASGRLTANILTEEEREKLKKAASSGMAVEDLRKMIECL